MRYICGKKILFLGTVLFCVVLLWSGPVFAVNVPQAASAMGLELDRQIVERLGYTGGISLSVTTPVDVNDLEVSNALAKQMQEEIARWFVQAGYDVHEIRKGANILFEPDQGELLLTRKQRLLGSTKVNSKAIVSGTYTVTPRNVRFNIRLVATGNREVLAMATITVPITREVGALLRVSGGKSGSFSGTPIEPTVVTLLP